MVSLRRVAGWSAIVAAIFGVASAALFVATAGFEGNDPAALLSAGAGEADLLRWAALTDMLGYYLLWIPVVLYLRERLRRRSSQLIDLYTVCGLGYVLIGAIGAVVLAVAGPPLIKEYAEASGSDKVVAGVVFTTVATVVLRGLWQTLESILMSVWFLGIGLVLRRDRRALGLAAAVMGVGALLTAAGTSFRLRALADAGLYLWLPLALVWLVWLGLDLLRGSDQAPVAAAHASSSRSGSNSDLGM